MSTRGLVEVPAERWLCFELFLVAAVGGYFVSETEELAAECSRSKLLRRCVSSYACLIFRCKRGVSAARSHSYFSPASFQGTGLFPETVLLLIFVTSAGACLWCAHRYLCTMEPQRWRKDGL